MRRAILELLALGVSPWWLLEPVGDPEDPGVPPAPAGGFRGIYPTTFTRRVVISSSRGVLRREKTHLFSLENTLGATFPCGKTTNFFLPAADWEPAASPLSSRGGGSQRNPSAFPTLDPSLLSQSPWQSFQQGPQTLRVPTLGGQRG